MRLLMSNLYHQVGCCLFFLLLFRGKRERVPFASLIFNHIFHQQALLIKEEECFKDKA